MSTKQSLSGATEAKAVADASGREQKEIVPVQLSKDTTFEILKNQRRRDTLAYLRRNGGHTELSDLAEFIAAKENDIEVRALSSDQRKRVYIGLYQCHLPKMADAGVIEFEKNRGNIELLPTAEQLFPYLEDETDGSAGDNANAAPRRNVAVAATVGLAVLAGLFGIPGFALVPAAGWALLSTLALLSMTALQMRPDSE